MTTLDPRLTGNGMAITVATLVAVFADHFRGVPAAITCPGCGHRFRDDGTGDCPTNTVARPLLLRRQHENPVAIAQLDAAAFDNLRKVKPKPMRANKPARPPATGDLFDTTVYRRHGGTR